MVGETDTWQRLEPRSTVPESTEQPSSCWWGWQVGGRRQRPWARNVGRVRKWVNRRMEGNDSGGLDHGLEPWPSDFFAADVFPAEA